MAKQNGASAAIWDRIPNTTGDAHAPEQGTRRFRKWLNVSVCSLTDGSPKRDPLAGAQFQQGFPGRLDRFRPDGPVWVTGSLKVASQFTGLAETGYAIDAESVETRKEERITFSFLEKDL